MELEIEEGEVVGEINENYENFIPSAKHRRTDRGSNEGKTAVPVVPDWQDDEHQSTVQAATPKRRPKKQKKKLQQLVGPDGSQEGQHVEGLEQPHYVDIYGQHVSVLC